MKTSQLQIAQIKLAAKTAEMARDGRLGPKGDALNIGKNKLALVHAKRVIEIVEVDGAITGPFSGLARAMIELGETISESVALGDKIKRALAFEGLK